MDKDIDAGEPTDAVTNVDASEPEEESADAGASEPEEESADAGAIEPGEESADAGASEPGDADAVIDVNELARENEAKGYINECIPEIDFNRVRDYAIEKIDVPGVPELLKEIDANIEEYNQKSTSFVMANVGGLISIMQKVDPVLDEIEQTEQKMRLR